MKSSSKQQSMARHSSQQQEPCLAVPAAFSVVAINSRSLVAGFLTLSSDMGHVSNIHTA